MSAPGKVTVENVSIDELKQGLADGSILLVDVREPNEYTATGRIPAVDPQSAAEIRSHGDPESRWQSVVACPAAPVAVR